MPLSVCLSVSASETCSGDKSCGMKVRVPAGDWAFGSHLQAWQLVLSSLAHRKAPHSGGGHSDSTTALR